MNQRRPGATTSPQFVDNAFKSRLQRYRSSTVEVHWTVVATPQEIGELVHCLDAEGVAVRFNRTRDRGTCVVTVMADGDYYNLYAQSREEWLRIFQDLVKP